MTDRLLVFAALAGLVLLVSPPAQAKPSAEDKEKAGVCQRDPTCRQHSEEGHRLYSDRKYAEALDEFQKAYDSKPEPRLLLNIGRTLYHLGRPNAAIKAYEQYQKDAPPDPDMERKLEKYIAEARIAVEAEKDSMPPPPPPVVTPVVQPAPVVEKPPVYKKWWFWTAIGGAAVAVGLGVGLGVGLTRPKPEPFVDVIWR